MSISLVAIGIIHSPFERLENMPIQPTVEAAAPGTVEVYPEFAEGLKDLQGFSHIYLLYYFHKTRAPQLLVKPFLDSQLRGIFATRAPVRPNPLGLSLVRIVKIRGNVIDVAALDVLDGTPLLDIKPYVPDFERPTRVRVGWLARSRSSVRKRRSDSRFK
jgi:tRNA-Thr(GGU) m(6)t(6)A37 methyltransferase TsaA